MPEIISKVEDSHHPENNGASIKGIDRNKVKTEILVYAIPSCSSVSMSPVPIVHSCFNLKHVVSTSRTALLQA